MKKVVYDPAKLVKMKAIHNNFGVFLWFEFVVYDPAKLVKMKAIHNLVDLLIYLGRVVYDPAKLVKMKAIHNQRFRAFIVVLLFMTLQS